MKPVKLVKIVAGCCLALAVSEAIGLRFATSSVIIAMLSIPGYPPGYLPGGGPPLLPLSPPQWQSPA